MDTISLLESFLHGENDSQSDTSISATNLAKPLLPKCPPKDSISVAQFQFFDNRDKPRKKGQSQYALKIEIYYGGVGQVVFQKPNWYRYVQLIAPKDVVAWARKKFAEDRFSQSIVDLYEQSLEVTKAFLDGNPNGQSWMGHISDPNNRGKHYYPGQFVIVTRTHEGDLEAHLIIEGDVVSCERFVRDKQRGQDGARDKYGFYDPFDVLPRQLEFLKQQREHETRNRASD
jgi:hypothetical protein